MSAEPDSTACEAAVPFATCTIVAFRPLSEKKPLRLATYSGSDANDVANWVIETAMGPPSAPEPPPEGGEPPPRRSPPDGGGNDGHGRAPGASSREHGGVLSGASAMDGYRVEGVSARRRPGVEALKIPLSGIAITMSTMRIANSWLVSKAFAAMFSAAPSPCWAEMISPMTAPPRPCARPAWRPR